MDQLDLGWGAPEPRPGPAARSAPASAQRGLFTPGAQEPGEGASEAERPTVAAPRPTIRGQVRVERVLRDLLGPKVMVTLTENRSTMLSYAVKRGVTYVRLHALFAEAPPHVLQAVATFASGHGACPRSGWIIDHWIEAHRPVIKNPARGPRIQPRGEVHDLLAIYDRLNAEYFRGRVDARITWSQAARKRRRSTIRMGSYSEDERLIRIHPALDQPFVPEFFVASVVFHEMLHQLHGASEGADGSRRVHTPAFRRDEAKFRDYARARAWEARNIRRLLRY